MRINDAHCHFFSRRFFDALARDDPQGRFQPQPSDAMCAALGWEPPGESAALAARWLESLDYQKVSRAVLIASVPGDEDSVAAAVAHAPDRFVGFFMVNPLAEDAPAHVERGLGSLGLSGVCLFPAMQRYHLHDPRSLAVIARVAMHPGVALFVHCGALTVGIRKKLGLRSRFDVRFGNPLDLHHIAGEYPSMPIVVPHFGAGLLHEALLLADLCPNVYLDTSSSNSWIRYFPGLTLADVFRQALLVAGPSRLLFGTDSSFFPRAWNRAIWDAQIEAMSRLGIPDSDLAQIVGGNFDRLFKPKD
jgi:hypothetical protein